MMIRWSQHDPFKKCYKMSFCWNYFDCFAVMTWNDFEVNTPHVFDIKRKHIFLHFWSHCCQVWLMTSKERPRTILENLFFIFFLAIRGNQIDGCIKKALIKIYTYRLESNSLALSLMEIFAIALKHKFSTYALSNDFTFYPANLKLHLFYRYL